MRMDFHKINEIQIHGLKIEIGNPSIVTPIVIHSLPRHPPPLPLALPLPPPTSPTAISNFPHVPCPSHSH
eukprot:UN09921